MHSSVGEDAPTELCITSKELCNATGELDFLTSLLFDDRERANIDHMSHFISIESRMFDEVLGKLENGALYCLFKKDIERCVMDWEVVKHEIGAFSANLAPKSGLIGLGTGSTSTEFIKALAQIYAKGNQEFQCIASSIETELLAKEKKLPLVEVNNWNTEIDVTFDGADAVDEEGTAIKGGGGALLREKILAHSSQRFIVMIDERKWKMPWEECILPVAIIPFGFAATLREIREKGMKPELRMREGTPFVTNDGLYIIDIPLTFTLHSLARLDRDLKEIPGVVETGIFFHFASEIVIGYGNGKVEHRMVMV
jgi:ribose 5-phosphate isomerase A